MKKILWPGLVYGVVCLVSGLVIGYLFMFFPAVSADYSNTGMMRSMNDPLMSVYYFYPFVQGIVFAWLWNTIKSFIVGSPFARAWRFGIMVWLVAMVPGMIISFSTMPLSILTVISWTVSGFVTAVLGGLVFVKMNR
jgi:hypothetical protein